MPSNVSSPGAIVTANRNAHEHIQDRALGKVRGNPTWMHSPSLTTDRHDQREHLRIAVVPGPDVKKRIMLQA